jgi:hypothetical protein
MPTTFFIAKPYPYKILAPEVDEKTLSNISLWDALEFFRIEALLRSEVVQSLYKKNATGGTLNDRYGITWDVLDGDHHALLRSSTREKAGIVDLSKWERIPTGSALQVISPIRDDPSRFLRLQLDCAVPPTTMIKALWPLLVERHRRVKVDLENDGPVLGLRNPRKRPPIRDVAAWLTYLKCYDLRQCSGLTFGKIAQQVFGPTVGRGAPAAKTKRTRYDQAERGYKAVKLLIRRAAANQWPPDLRQ